ncbi:MAG: KdsC family phosphatase [Candidatus Helarchaeota archaeon]
MKKKNNSIKKERIKKIKMLILDVDGVLTNGEIILGTNEELKIFNVQDGMGITLANDAGILTVILTGRKSLAVERRGKELKFAEVFQGIKNKIEILEILKKKYKLQMENLAYIGDDLLDIKIMQSVGISFAPKNAIDDVKDIVDYVSDKEGGRGAIREIVEYILKSQGIYNQLIKKYYL